MRPLLLISLWLVFVSTVSAQTKTIDSLRTGLARHPQASSSIVVRYDTMPEKGILLNKGWKYHQGDSPAWASPTLDDRNWQSIDPGRLPQIHTQGIGWIRLHLHISSKLQRQSLILRFQQFIASEIYLNGRLLHRFGKVSAQPNQVTYVRANSDPVGIIFDEQAEQVLAIRFSRWPTEEFINPFRISLIDLTLLNKLDAKIQEDVLPNGIGFGICLLLALLHLTFFRYNPAQRANLYFTFHTVTLSTFFFLGIYLSRTESMNWYFYGTLLLQVVIQAIFLWPLRVLYALFDRPPNLLYYGFWVLLLVTFGIVHWLSFELPNWLGLSLSLIQILLPILEQLRLIWQAIRQQKRGAYIIASGFAAAFLLIVGRILLGVLGVLAMYEFSSVGLLLLFLCPVLGFSLYLAREFALDSQLLQVKLIQVQELSALTLAQEQEKQHLLSVQNETLEQQVTERTAQLQQSLDELRTTQQQLIQKEKMASLGELTAGIAHEIQNPLNFVNNFSEVSTELVEELKEGPFQQLLESEKDYADELLGDLTQNLQKITQHGQRASNIVKGMLEHSRSSTGEVQPTNLNALAEEYLRLAYHGQRAKDKDFSCELVTHFDPAIDQVNLMAQEMGRVLLNLFTNAFYAVRERMKQTDSAYQPTVTVGTQKTQSGIEIRVSDNGTGMAESVQQKIFQPFFTTKPTGEGTGLGLSLSYDIVTKGHGGSLMVTSQEGQGTQFMIQLPA